MKPWLLACAALLAAGEPYVPPKPLPAAPLADFTAQQAFDEARTAAGAGAWADALRRIEVVQADHRGGLIPLRDGRHLGAALVLDALCAEFPDLDRAWLAAATPRAQRALDDAHDRSAVAAIVRAYPRTVPAAEAALRLARSALTAGRPAEAAGWLDETAALPAERSAALRTAVARARSVDPAATAPPASWRATALMAERWQGFAPPTPVADGWAVANADTLWLLAADGALRWSSAIMVPALAPTRWQPLCEPHWLRPAPAAADGLVAAVVRRRDPAARRTDGWTLVVHDVADGRLRWSLEGHDAWADLDPISAPALRDGLAAVVCLRRGLRPDLVVVACDARQGTPLWTAYLHPFDSAPWPIEVPRRRGDPTLTGPGMGMAAPLIADGAVWLAAEHGQAACLSAADGAVRWLSPYARTLSADPGALAPVRVAARSDDRLIAFPRDAAAPIARKIIAAHLGVKVDEVQVGRADD